MASPYKRSSLSLAPRTAASGAAPSLSSPSSAAAAASSGFDDSASPVASPAVPPSSSSLEHGSRQVRAWAARERGLPLTLTTVSLPPLQADEVEVRVLVVGLCCSDIDALGRFGALYQFPLVAGHEGVGTVSAIGSAVRHLSVGDRCGVGVFRSACGACQLCLSGANHQCAVREQMFAKGKHGAFAEYVRIKAEFAVPIPDAIDTLHAGPLMCAGVAAYAPFRTHNFAPGSRVGVLGLGGLGHLAVQFGAKMGHEVVALSTSADKASYARSMGAHRFVNIMHEAEIRPLFGTLDALLLTASGDSLDWRALLGLLGPGGRLIVLGVSFKEQVLSPVQLLAGGKSVCGATAGSTGMLMECLRFCATHGIKPVVEMFPIAKVNEAIDKVVNNQVRFRAVLQHQH